jgi:tRNA(Met) C34 N-acetyltransferase TmcA
MKELNEKLSVICRVGVHPKYRTIGLGTKLIKDTLMLAGKEYVGMSAVMARYNPFTEKAGMRKVAEQPPSQEAGKIAELLAQLGFDCQLLGSRKYVLAKLQTLSSNDLAKVKQAFIKNRHPRFLKSFSYDLPFGTKEEYMKRVEEADLGQLAHLIKVCGFLLQTKVYLFWKNLNV